MKRGKEEVRTNINQDGGDWFTKGPEVNLFHEGVIGIRDCYRIG